MIGILIYQFTIFHIIITILFLKVLPADTLFFKVMEEPYKIYYTNHIFEIKNWNFK